MCTTEPSSSSSSSSSSNATFQWNSTIRRSGPEQALRIYTRSVLRSGAAPNKFTFTFLLKSLLRSSPSLLRFLPHLHSHLTILGLHSDPFLLSSLIAAYARADSPSVAARLFRQSPYKDTVLRTALVSALAKCRLPDLARHAFDEMPHPNPVSWAALISAYARAGRPADALSTFLRMRAADVAPTEAALASALSAASNLGAAEQGECVHCVAVRNGPPTAAVCTAALTMYASCGRVEDASKAFDEMLDRDSAAWTAMISALASHGRGGDALRLFDGMVESGATPDYVTYVGVLHACGHAGLVHEAGGYFRQMTTVYGIVPRAEHYGCMVDVLGRAGRVEEAWELVRLMPMEPDEYVLKSLLSACCSSDGFVEYAEWAAEKLRRLDVRHASSYVLLSNAYIGTERWEESARVRRLMRELGVRKSSGQSSVD
ncbi:pentatricopeptide repeat-containing protein-like [Iris pallida]|uniref:Pentatricopeptide repeat-containing protein-like n=1 Tax=Iris pallida TaxID=29817 RepID=A0AAX6GK01_IRIPA|nr:pentatricopeptide repeat-containing protein-like [Iris pallida]